MCLNRKTCCVITVMSGICYIFVVSVQCCVSVASLLFTFRLRVLHSLMYIYSQIKGVFPL